jgi:hypothetical protein
MRRLKHIFGVDWVPEVPYEDVGRREPPHAC